MPLESQPAPTARGELVRAALIIIAVLVALLLLWQTRLLMLLSVLGLLLGIAAKPAVDWLEKRKFRRSVASPLIVLGTVMFIGAVALWSGPTLVMQFNVLRTQVPQSIDKLDAYFEKNHNALLNAVLPPVPADTTVRDTSVVRDSTASQGRLRKAILGQVAGLRGFVLTTVTSTFALVAGLLYVLVLTIYFAIEPQTYRRGVLLLVPLASRDRGALLIDIVTATLRKWLSTQFIAMLVIGTVTTIVLFLLGVKAAIPLGILAGILEFVPTLGPLMSAIPAVLISFADSPQKAMFVAIAYWGIQLVENHVLIPHLMREELDLPPALTLLWQALMGVVFGLLGLFVAVPLLAAGVVTVRYLYVRGDVPPVRRLRGSREVRAVSDEFPPT